MCWTKFKISSFNISSGSIVLYFLAFVLNSYILEKIKNKEYKKVLFVATGALLSTTSSQQGDTIPGIAHAVVIESGDEIKNKNMTK